MSLLRSLLGCCLVLAGACAAPAGDDAATSSSAFSTDAAGPDLDQVPAFEFSATNDYAGRLRISRDGGAFVDAPADMSQWTRTRATDVLSFSPYDLGNYRALPGAGVVRIHFGQGSDAKPVAGVYSCATGDAGLYAFDGAESRDVFRKASSCRVSIDAVQENAAGMGPQYRVRGRFEAKVEATDKLPAHAFRGAFETYANDIGVMVTASR